MATSKSRTATRRRQRPGKALTRREILRTGIEQANLGGLEHLSMRKLAAALGVEAMSLYNHIDNKDDLVDGMLDLVIAEFHVPSTSKPWQESMRLRAVSAHTVLLEHPWAASLMLSRIIVGPAMLAWGDATIGCLHTAGFSYPMADHASNAMDNHIYGFTLHVVNAPMGPEEYAQAAEHYLPQIPQERYPHIHAMATLVRDGHHSGVNEFEFGLGLILDGLSRQLRKDSIPH